MAPSSEPYDLDFIALPFLKGLDDDSFFRFVQFFLDHIIQQGSPADAVTYAEFYDLLASKATSGLSARQATLCSRLEQWWEAVYQCDWFSSVTLLGEIHASTRKFHQGSGRPIERCLGFLEFVRVLIEGQHLASPTLQKCCQRLLGPSADLHTHLARSCQVLRIVGPCLNEENWTQYTSPLKALLHSPELSPASRTRLLSTLRHCIAQRARIELPGIKFSFNEGYEATAINRGSKGRSLQQTVSLLLAEYETLHQAENLEAASRLRVNSRSGPPVSPRSLERYTDWMINHLAASRSPSQATFHSMDDSITAADTALNSTASNSTASNSTDRGQQGAVGGRNTSTRPTTRGDSRSTRIHPATRIVSQHQDSTRSPTIHLFPMGNRHDSPSPSITTRTTYRSTSNQEDTSYDVDWNGSENTPEESGPTTITGATNLTEQDMKDFLMVLEKERIPGSVDAFTRYLSGRNPQELLEALSLLAKTIFELVTNHPASCLTYVEWCDSLVHVLETDAQFIPTPIDGELRWRRIRASQHLKALLSEHGNDTFHKLVLSSKFSNPTPFNDFHPMDIEYILQQSFRTRRLRFFEFVGHLHLRDLLQSDVIDTWLQGLTTCSIASTDRVECLCTCLEVIGSFWENHPHMSYLLFWVDAAMTTQNIPQEIWSKYMELKSRHSRSTTSEMNRGPSRARA